MSLYKYIWDIGCPPILMSEGMADGRFVLKMTTVDPIYCLIHAFWVFFFGKQEVYEDISIRGHHYTRSAGDVPYVLYEDINKNFTGTRNFDKKSIV